MPIVEGRNFNSTDTPTSPRVIIINQAMARKYWPNGSAIGKRIRERKYEGPEAEVVGVSADYKVNTIGEAATPYILYDTSQRIDTDEAIIARTSGDASAVVDAMRREMLTLEPNLVFLDQQTMDAQIGATLLPARAGAISVSAVGVVAMVLAAIGLYGVIAYAVARRAHEIGIRMALGATAGAVAAMMMRQGLRIAGVGSAAGSMLAIGAAHAVAGVLYGVSAADPVTWVGSIAAVFAVTAVANLVPARRAARVDPLLALRSE